MQLRFSKIPIVTVCRSSFKWSIQVNFNLWRHRPRNFPTASRYKELCRQSAIPTCSIYHRYLYISFAEFSEERICGDRRGTSNKHTCSRDIEGRQRKDYVVSNKQVYLKLRSTTGLAISKPLTKSWSLHFLFWIVDRWL